MPLRPKRKPRPAATKNSALCCQLRIEHNVWREQGWRDIGGVSQGDQVKKELSSLQLWTDWPGDRTGREILQHNAVLRSPSQANGPSAF